MAMLGFADYSAIKTEHDKDVEKLINSVYDFMEKYGEPRFTISIIGEYVFAYDDRERDVTHAYTGTKGNLTVETRYREE